MKSFEHYKLFMSCCRHEYVNDAKIYVSKSFEGRYINCIIFRIPVSVYVYIYVQLQDCSQSNSSFDLHEIRQSLFLETEEAQPVKLISGKGDVLFHYVKLDSVEGVLLYPPDRNISSPLLNMVMDSFRSCSQHIHNLFQDTLRFKVDSTMLVIKWL